MNQSPQFYAEVHERAVRRVRESRADYPALWAAIESVAPMMGCVPQTLNDWVRKVDSGQRPGITTSDAQRIKELGRDVRKLRRPNDTVCTMAIADALLRGSAAGRGLADLGPAV